METRAVCLANASQQIHAVYSSWPMRRHRHGRRGVSSQLRKVSSVVIRPVVTPCHNIGRFRFDMNTTFASRKTTDWHMSARIQYKWYQFEWGLPDGISEHVGQQEANLV
jgi:hypothetical protein